MRTTFCFAILVAVIVAAGYGVSAQSTPAKPADPTGSVSGTVTVSGKHAPAIKVVALRGERYEQKVLASDRTDVMGRYRLNAIPIGDCTVTVDAASFATSSDQDDSSPSRKHLTLEEGESVEGLDLEITPGGVITGRVVDAGGRPIIGETVRAIPYKEQKEDNPSLPSFMLPDALKTSTDDRGVYRAFGLPPGRYRVQVGEDRSYRKMQLFFGRVAFPQTYYPSVREESKAGIVEVTAGGEATNIDVTINRPSASGSGNHTVTGRTVDAETGKPVPGASFWCTAEISNQEDGTRHPGDPVPELGESDSKGDFRVEGLPPGTYGLEIRSSSDSPWYSEKVPLVISDSDVAGVELRLRHAGSISGTLVLEGTSDAQVLARFYQIKVGEDPDVSGGAGISRDGTFHLAGVGPGSHTLRIDSASVRGGFDLLGVERDGVEQQLEEIKVGPGENATGVRAFVGYYRGSVRGTITIVGELPKGASLEISATLGDQATEDQVQPIGKRLAPWGSRFRQGSIDSRGRYVIDRLSPGEYEIELDAYLIPLKDDPGRDAMPITVTKVVNVTGDAPVELPIVLDLSNRPEIKRQ